MFAQAAHTASQMMFGMIRRMSESYHEDKGEKEKGKERLRVGKRGLTMKQVQFPVGEVLIGPLEPKADWMRQSEVMQWVVEPEDEEGVSDILLEGWTIGRFSHHRTMEMGALFQVKLVWGMASIAVNIAAVKDYVPLDKMPCVLPSGMGNAFVIKERHFNTFRIYAGGHLVEGASMGARLLYLCAFDLDSHQALTVDDFEQWDEEDVMALLVEHQPGSRFRRPTPEEAGMITIRRTGSDSIQIPQEEEDDWMDGNDTETSGSDLGQSPELNESCGRHPGQSPLPGFETLQRGKRSPTRTSSSAEAAFIKTNQVVEEMQRQPPPPPVSPSGLGRWNSRMRTINLGSMVTGYGPGPGGWTLDKSDWVDINLVLQSRSKEEPRAVGGSQSGSNITDSTYWSPRAELSQEGLEASSGGDSLDSPEAVMKRVKEELGIEDDEKMEQSSGVRKRKRGSSSGSSIIFSPFLASKDREIVTVSTSTSGGSGVTGPGVRNSPVFTFDINHEMRRYGWGGVRNSGMGAMAHPAAVAQAMADATGMNQGGMFVDDQGFSQPGRNEIRDKGGERGEEGDTMEMEDNEEVFNLSNVE